jgi:regulator of sigma E protease
METFIKIAQFLLSLSLLIVLHEFGHFIAARIFNTRVEKFFLFFDAWGKSFFHLKKEIQNTE